MYALNIKYFSETHFSRAMILTCFFIDSLNVYKWIECVSEAFDLSNIAIHYT